MNKYLNIIIITFFAPLTYKLNISFSLYICIITFLVFINQKNLFLILPLSILSVYLFIPNQLIEILSYMISLIIYLLILKKKNNIYLDVIYVYIITFFILILGNNAISKRDILLYLIYSLIGVLIYIYCYFNYTGIEFKKTKLRSFAYIEAIIAIISIIGASNITIREVNIGLVIGIYYAMYLSSNTYIIQSIVVSIISMFYLKYINTINISLILPIISLFYLFPSVYGSLALVIACILAYYFKIQYVNKMFLLVLMGLVVFFEIFKIQIVNVKDNKKLIIKKAYEASITNINNEMLGFASFLDLFSKKFTTSKEYKNKLSEGISSLTANYCDSCYSKNECFSKNKGKLYTYFKSLILYPNSSGNDNSVEQKNFYRTCPYIIEMRKSAIIINNRLNINQSISKTNALVSQMNGVSNILRQYAVDASTKLELDYELISDLKRALCESGLNITFFEIKKIFVNDYQIDVGIRATYKEINQRLEKIASSYLGKSSIIYNKSEKSKVYVSIVPKLNFEVSYGYGSLAVNGVNVCGDNYFIKNLNTSKLIAAISDGMGKGLSANEESSATLKLIDVISDINLATETYLQILNTFYYIQDYLEHYATLDFIEINRSIGEASFYKMGASTSYIFHGNGTYEKILNESLPFGIEEIIDIKNIKLSDQDIIIMASDGVFENIVNEKELEEYIKQILHLEPQKIAYELLNYTKSHKTKTNDDMSVIALKIQTAN